jgi:site-specific DNA-methyltransferase (adenine-specific)
MKPPVNEVMHADALNVLRLIDNESVDCFVTSPPYNLLNSTGNGNKGDSSKGIWPSQPMHKGYDGGAYADNMPIDEYIAWQRDCLSEMFRIVKPTGAIFYNHKWRVQAGLLERTADKITEGFPVRQIIIWDRGGGFNFNPTYFVPNYEVIYFICQDGFRIKNGAVGHSDVWSIMPARNKEHPNSFPEELVEKCILAATHEGDLVVDPFGGAGTTALVARRLKRNYLLTEINERYVKLARWQLRNEIAPRDWQKETKIDDLPLFERMDE